MATWIVEPYGWSDEEFEAETKDKARYAAFKALREAGAFQGRDGFWRYLVNGVIVYQKRPHP